MHPEKPSVPQFDRSEKRWPVNAIIVSLLATVHAERVAVRHHGFTQQKIKEVSDRIWRASVIARLVKPGKLPDFPQQIVAVDEALLAKERIVLAQQVGQRN